MADEFTHETWLSPFTWRYGSEEMRRIWSVAHKRRLWRQIWVAMAEAQQEAGLVTSEQVADLRAHQDEINLARAHELEAELHHDLMAEVHTFAEQCPVGGGIIHLGATSMDVEDNADALRLRESSRIILEKLGELLGHLVTQMETHADTVCMAFTHLQPAEPTTIGYRLAFYAQDLFADYQNLQRISLQIRGKGFKGAVGTSASYSQLLIDSDKTTRDLESRIMNILRLEAFEVANQTYPRRQDWDIVNVLAGIAMTIYKFAFDLRLLQSPPLGEWSEPFGSRQIGSSAMPFKRNPINAENLDSLARYVASLPRVLWDNAAHSLLERTLDDSANRREVLPVAFLATDELLKRMTRIIKDIRFDEHAIKRNMQIYGVFSATERLLMAAVRNGGDRQQLHEVIREHSLKAWEALRQDGVNPLADSLAQEESFTTLLSADEIRELLNADEYVGDAPERTQNLIRTIRDTVANPLLI